MRLFLSRIQSVARGLGGIMLASMKAWVRHRAPSKGAAGFMAVVIIWAYYSAQIFFLGAEITREYALAFGSHRGRERKGEPLDPATLKVS